MFGVGVHARPRCRATEIPPAWTAPGAHRDRDRNPAFALDQQVVGFFLSVDRRRHSR